MDGKIFEKLIEVSECAFFISKPGGEMEITYASKKFYSILQYTKEEFQEKFKNSLMAVILPEEKQKVKNLIARQFAAGGAVNIECRVKRKDGTTAWLSISAKTLLHMSENRFFCSCLDITKSRNNVENMFKAKHEIDVIANSIPGGVLKIRMKDMKILYANDGYYMLSGYSRAEFHINFGDYCDKIIYPADMKMVKSVFGTTVENNGLLGFEHRIVGKTGHTKWLYVNGRKIDDESGEDVYLCVLMDVTSRKSMEAEFEENIRRFKYVSEYLKETMWTYDINNKTFTRSGSLGESFSKENFLRTWDDMPEMLELFHPDDAKIFVERTGIDALAVAIGNAHGKYPVAPKLAFDVLEQIHDKTGIPLVLHGGSGITDADFRKAIELGIVKVNIATASFNRLTKHAEEYLKSEGVHNYFDLNVAMVQGTYENVRHHIEVFNCEMPLDEVDA